MTPVNARAYRLVRTAIKNGVLVRPHRCSRCGSADTKPTSGRHTIQAHHHKGYGHPLEVTWLCARCHRAEAPSQVPRKPPLSSSEMMAKIEALSIPEPNSGCWLWLGGVVDEVASADGHRFDAVAASALIRDPEVMTWLDGMRGMALLPVKRK